MEDSTPRDVSRIVVGVDGSPESVQALKWAAALAPALGAVIVAVTAWHFETVVSSYAAAEWDPEADAVEVMTDAVSEAFGEEPPEGLRTLCLRGNPAQALIEAGRNARMIIVGSRGRGGFAGLLLGSVSQACVQHASCPVLVVHRGSAAPGTSDDVSGKVAGERPGSD